MPSPPTVVFVHGAWHTPECWTKVIPRLEAQNYRCATVRLASTLGNPAATFGDDVAAVQAVIKEHTSQGRNVLVVGHSYGGAVSSTAIKGLTKPAGDNTETPGTGYVVGLMLITTTFIKTGSSFGACINGSQTETGGVSVDAANGWMVVDGNPRDIFYNDLSIEEAAEWGAKLQKQAIAVLVDETGYAGWKDVPVWFLAAKQDHIIAYESQKQWCQAAIAEGANVKVLELDSSHSPFLSQPVETTNFIQGAILALS
ncbi:Alpha/beta hydrolase fold-1 [Plectosphaerella plurivora]|uniref:Alpha/beta hydrolase fold-1 n=1 Tax=Plectosphaerella plurivora TaxID=936078 RepID=A0A9P9ACS1_9PEZI|nr:Alpha/beta hydrolase fold-1 [Plectosphaerella plurivora]